MTKEMLKYWAFNRCLGLKDFGALCKALKRKKTETPQLSSPNHLSEIIVGHDEQIDKWIEPMAAGTES
jgi:hypothetical protein